MIKDGVNTVCRLPLSIRASLQVFDGFYHYWFTDEEHLQITVKFLYTFVILSVIDSIHKQLNSSDVEQYEGSVAATQPLHKGQSYCQHAAFRRHMPA